MGTESPKRNAFALGFSLPLASFFRVTETKTLFGLRFGPPLATAKQPNQRDVSNHKIEVEPWEKNPLLARRPSLVLQ